MKKIANSIPKILLLTSAIIVLSGVASCKESPRFTSKDKTLTIVLQPLGEMQQVSRLADSIKNYYRTVTVAKSTDLPRNAFYPNRNRYRADSLIRMLALNASPNTVVLGLTNKDISTSVHGHEDWGVMGLAYEPGKAGVISSYRLSHNNTFQQLLKVALHELGHTQGLPHCEHPTCFMRDAGGKNITDQLTGFCTSCANHLAGRNWKL